MNQGRKDSSDQVGGDLSAGEIEGERWRGYGDRSGIGVTVG